MIVLLLYYVILPLIAAWLLIKFIKKYGGSPVPGDLQRMLLVDPIERRMFRAVRRDSSGLFKLGDFDKHEEAVDRIYVAREEAQKAGLKASLLVLNDAGETLDLIES